MRGTTPENRLAREVRRVRQELLNSVAHELNTPLTPVLIHLRRLEMRAAEMDPELEESFQVIHRNIERLLERVHTIIRVTQMESGRFPVQMRKVSLDRIVHEAHGDYRAVAETAGIHLKEYDDTGAFIYADPRRLKTVFEVLLDNSIKFTPTGGEVEIVAEPGTLMADIQVGDTGVGFDPDQKHLLFKPFSQLDTGVPHAYHGAGLGLFIAKGIIDLHGGEIDAHSDGPGTGATFTFRIHLARRSMLPVSESEAPDQLVSFNNRIRNLI